MSIRIVLRSLFRSRAFLLTATAVLALGIGVNLAFLAVLQANLTRRPPHVSAPESVYELSFDETSFDGTTIQEERTSYPRFELIREVLRGTAEVACFYAGPVGVGQGLESKEVLASVVSRNFFHLLGVEPLQGRWFSEEEQDWHTDGGSVAVVDSRFWRETFPGTPIGDVDLIVADRPVAVVGVSPEGFRGVSRRPSQVWLPLETSVDLVSPFDRPALEIISDARSRLFQILLRPAPGQSPESLRAILLARLVESEPGSEVIDVHLRINNSAQLTPFSRKLLQWGAFMALLTLFVACANVATLGLLRGLRCAEKMAVQHQLGATRAAILRQSVTESAILVGLATIVAAGLFLPIATLLGGSLGLPPLSLIELSGLQSWRTLALILFAVWALIATPSAFQSARLALCAADARSSPRSGRAKACLVFFQVSLTTILLAQAGLFYASIRDAIGGLGYQPGNLVMAEAPNLRRLGYSEVSVQALYERLEERARHLPGTVSTARSTSGPDRCSLITSVRGPDRQLPRPSEGVYVSGVSPGYIDVMGMRLLAGRDFRASDSENSESVVILNAALASRLWESGSAVGGCIYLGRAEKCSTVVGVLGDSRIETTVFADPRLHCYLPLTQYAAAGLGSPSGDYLFVRVAEGTASSTIDQLKSAPFLPSYVFASQPGESVRLEISAMEAGLRILGLLALAAVGVSAVGMFGQLSYWVDSRRRELGIRLALGARSPQIVGDVVRAGAAPVCMGVAIGLVASDPVSDLARGFVFGLSPLPVLFMGGVVLIVLLVAALACFNPCVRALRIDPLEVLRNP